MTDRATIVDICDRYIAGVAAGDVDAVMALYGADPVVEDPIGSEPKRGRDAVRAFYQGVVDMGVKLSMARVGPVCVVGDEAGFMFRIDIDLGETTMSMTTLDTMIFDADGLIVSMRAYADGEADPDDG
ncbi:MAG: nuclear transport factor 2 family protein [Acidimicrobiales bacterium]|jgi:steroid delta-isomerase|nr:nuclear transport factor 2 family protein [Acidimicrobiales bacterium]